MPESKRDGSSILLVDDEEALAWSLYSRLRKFRPSYRVQTANDGESALAKFQRKPFDLLVADVRMPGMTGVDLILAARSLKPQLPVIVMTAFKTSDLQRLEGRTRIQYLDKPFKFEKFVAAVDEALLDRSGFSGAISVPTLPDVVQLYVLSNTTGALRVRHGDDQGTLWFDHGTLPHAVTNTSEGAEAFYEIMTWRGGEFSMQIDAQAPARTIKNHWQELLMESCRRIDEAGRRGKKSEPVKGGEAMELAIQADDPFGSFTITSLTKTLEKPTEQAQTQSQSHSQTPEATMNIKDSLNKLNQMDGFVGAALVDAESGMLLGQEGGGSLNLEIAAASNSEVVKAKRKAITNLALKESIEDILITLGKQYHLIRPLRSRPNLFFYIALDRSRGNLALARMALADVEKDLQI